MNDRSIPGAFAALANEKYVSLTTYRKSGKAVATPLWFVMNASGLYIETPSGSGKVKRIRNSGRAELAPCTARGKVTGAAIPARASLVPAGSAGRVKPALVKKYGLLKRAADLFVRVRRPHHLTIRVVPE